jgi:hypothetical protein
MQPGTCPRPSFWKCGYVPCRRLPFRRSVAIGLASVLLFRSSSAHFPQNPLGLRYFRSFSHRSANARTSLQMGLDVHKMLEIKGFLVLLGGCLGSPVNRFVVGSSPTRGALF